MSGWYDDGSEQQEQAMRKARLAELEAKGYCEHGIPRRFCTALHAETVNGDA